MSEDHINPRHYKAHGSNIEAITIVEQLSFNVGSAVKYCWRVGLKTSETPERDLAKACWYLRREQQRIANDHDAVGPSFAFNRTVDVATMAHTDFDVFLENVKKVIDADPESVLGQLLNDLFIGYSGLALTFSTSNLLEAAALNLEMALERVRQEVH